MERGKLYPRILLGLTLLLPVTMGLLSLFGFALQTRHPLVPMVLSTCVFIAVAAAVLRLPPEERGERSALYGLTVLGTVARFCAVFLLSSILPMLLLALLWVLMSAVVWCFRPGTALRRVVRGVAALGLCSLMVCVGAIGFFAAQIGTVTVTQELTSSDGRYCAQVVNVDQGALGGNTVVRVARTGGLNLYFYEIVHDSEPVYIGPWGNADTLPVEWTAHRELTVMGQTYEIK